jgi:hypothetical protein
VSLDVPFLEWLRQQTESRWLTHTPQSVKGANVGGLDWQTGTRWRGGMTDDEIAAAQERFGLVFPPDHRLFLGTLHTPDPEMVGATFAGGYTLVPTTGRQFHDWTGDPAVIAERIAWPLEGLLWSIEQDHGWFAEWGERPRTEAHREAKVRELAAAGAQLVPICGHRYLAGSPDRVGNPVLSIYGADTIIYAGNLRLFLPLELGLQSRPGAIENSMIARGEPIPFWQDVIDGEYLSGLST